MSTVKVVKGKLISLVIGVTNEGEPVNINDGEWSIDLDLRYQTKVGNKPFEIEGTPVGNSISLVLTAEQTSQLNHLGAGYILTVSAKNNDGVNIMNYINVAVLDVL